MKYIEFDNSKEFDLILLGRVAVDLNPVDYYCPLNESTTFKRYLGGSPANIAVGLARLGKKCGFMTIYCSLMLSLENMLLEKDKFDGIDVENVVGTWRVNIPYSTYTGE